MKAKLAALCLITALGACSGEAREETAGHEEAASPAPATNPAPAPADQHMTDPAPLDLSEEAKAASQGMSWHFKTGWALFGPPSSEGMISLRCTDEGEGVSVTRIPDSTVETGAQATLRFQSSKGSATAAMTAHESDLGPAIWEGAPSSVATLAALFDGEAMLIATLNDARPLALPADPKVAALIRECGARL